MKQRDIAGASAASHSTATAVNIRAKPPAD